MSYTARRSVLATAIFCAVGASPVVQAQSSVTVFGLVDASVGRFQAPGGTSITAVESGKMTTSNWGIRGSEDLGGGLKASFSIESFFRADVGAVGRFNGDPMFTRSAWVGLSGGFGSVNLGRNTTSLFQNVLRFNAFGDSFGFSPSIRHYFSSNTATGDTGWSDSIKYVSPNFGGLFLTLHAAAKETDGGYNKGASATYSGGPLGLSATWQKVEKGATVNDTDTWSLGGSYDFKVIRVFAQYGDVDNDTVVNTFKISGLGASVPIGAGSALLQWGQVKPDTGAKRDTLSVGYDYFLSKRTDVYAVFMNDKLSGVSAGKNYGLGIRHRF